VLHPPSLASYKSDRRLCTPPLMVAPMALMGTVLTPTTGIVDLDACSSKPMTWSHVRSFPIHPRPISCPTLAFCLSLTHHGFRLSHRSLVVQTWVNYLNCIFPKFDGDNPKLWQAKCENYFDMYTVAPSVWVRVATMHFEGPIAKWLQSVHHRICSATWSELCS
jgi:hypothetical protein